MTGCNPIMEDRRIGLKKRGQIFGFDNLEIICLKRPMARPLRIEYPGAYYHVMNRGNRREDIFLTDKDRQVFLDGLADSCEIYSIKLIAYVLMSNHFHLLVQTPQANLSEFMRHFLVTCTVRFNRRNGRAGLKSNRKLKNQFHRIREQINKLSNSKI